MQNLPQLVQELSFGIRSARFLKDHCIIVTLEGEKLIITENLHGFTLNGHTFETLELLLSSNSKLFQQRFNEILKTKLLEYLSDVS